MTNVKQSASFWCKPFRILLATFVNWWIPRVCLFFCIIFYFVVAFGFNIGVHLSVYDLNENISSREVMWHMVNIFWSFIVAFFCIEWWRDDHLQRTEDQEIKAYNLGNIHRCEDDEDVFGNSVGHSFNDKRSDDEEKL